MENYYFPLFLVVLAAAVVLFFKKVSSGNRSRRGGLSKSPAGRSASGDRLQRSLDRRGPAAPRRPVVKKDIWQTKRQRAAQDSFVEAATRPGVHHAGYIGPYDDIERRGRGVHELKDQKISKFEHLGIDEYLTKREREKAEAEAEEAGELSMTAMKYEPGDASSEEGKGRKKRAGFKP